MDILPAIAHTDAVYEDVVKAFENGYTFSYSFLFSNVRRKAGKNAFRLAGVIESV